MRQHKMKLTVTMAAVGWLGAFGVLSGCNTGTSTDEATPDEAAVKAASPDCVSARDACKTKLESIASTIQAACTTHDACRAAFEAAKPDLQAAAKACETSIQTACVLDVGGAGHGSFGGNTGHGAFGGNTGHGAFGGNTGHGAFGGAPGNNHDGGVSGHGDSAACEAAETTCREALQSLRSMPPEACTTISTACASQMSMTPTDACKTAISDCKAAVTTSAAGTHDTCGSAIVAACGGHGG
jgi:hypothetical protein